jgi:hypothetical protein
MSDYKSVTLLAAENPNLAEYLKQLEQEIKRLRAELHAAGDGDTWEAACKRLEVELAAFNTTWQHDPPEPGDTRWVRLRVMEIDPVIACDFPGMSGIVVETVEPPRA